ncbi:MAG: Tim44 domain-containing protein [Alphaproteobacteria bacterium]|nr:Tim44 domain-containing protein [Alphaproteobacteria bacterium]
MTAYMDLIFLGLVVALILYRLNSVLGTRPEQPQIKIVSKKEFEKIYDMIQGKIKEDEKFADIKVSETPADEVLKNIEFDKVSFLKRASKAFEMVLEAFANRDLQTLKMLTTHKLYEKFEAIIKEREEQNISAESDLIRIDEMEIVDAQISPKNIAQIAVKFKSDQINVLKNAQGEVIEGDENFVQQITDVWTFEKNLNNNSPVWLLNSTKKKQ